MTRPPNSLLVYMDGLKTRDVTMIGRSLTDAVRFVTPVRTMNKSEILAFLSALYDGFPDWNYDNDPPESVSDGHWRVKWRQGGIHTRTLALPGFPAVPATNRNVHIPQQFFNYRIGEQGIDEIRPDPITGGAPGGIFQQIGVALPPL